MLSIIPLSGWVGGRERERARVSLQCLIRADVGRGAGIELELSHMMNTRMQLNVKTMQVNCQSAAP